MKNETNKIARQLRPGQAERIAHLFKRGHSLDLVSELGLLYGWTRLDAKDVVATMGWHLDWSGRLRISEMKATMPAWPTVANADSERLLNAGIDHEDADVRRVALAAERAVERLRTVLMANEQADELAAKETRRVLAQEEVAKAFSSVLGGLTDRMPTRPASSVS